MTPTVPHQALYRRWRAQTFSQIVGQEAVVETLRNAVRTDRVSHAVLFVGPRGTGKTSLARILAKAVNCTDLRDGDPCDACAACVSIREGSTLDVIEIDAASNRGIEEIRDLRERLAYPPGHLRRKVYILDEAHQITPPAWNALLKSLEEPPGFVLFLFASTEPSRFPPAIMSRLQRFDVRGLTIPEIEGKLARILEAEARTIEPAAMTLIARLAAGGMRDAESILDQLLSTTSETVTEAAVRDLLGLADAAAVDGFIDALAGGDAAGGIALLDALEERGRDPRAFLDQVVDAVRARLVDAAATGTGGSALADLARRLVAIDPDRAGIGGLRLQLELALFAGPAVGVPASPLPADAVPRPQPVAAQSASPEGVAATTGSPAPAPRAPAGPTETAPPPAPDRAPAKSPPPPAAAPVPEPASPPAPAAAAPPSTPSGGGSDGAVIPGAALSLESVLAAWPAIVALLSGKPAIKQLISTCRPVSLDGAIVTLGFPEEQAFLRDHAERKKTEIEAGIREVLGRDVGIRCVVANIEVVAAAPAADDDGFLMSEARRIFGEYLVDVVEVD